MCLQIVSKLKEEIGAMEREHSELQQHITRTDWWCENLGHWRATITTAEVRLCFFSLFTNNNQLILLMLENQANVNCVVIETFVCKTIHACVFFPGYRGRWRDSSFLQCVC